MREDIFHGPIASTIALLSDIYSNAAFFCGKKVRLLGCISDYDPISARALIFHSTCAIEVDISLLPNLRFDIGDWIFVIGIIEQVSINMSWKNFSHSIYLPIIKGYILKAILLWNAGNIDVDKYEKVFLSMTINQSPKIDPNDWTYLSEGNQNVIFKYIGNDSSFINKVLRIKKMHHSISTSENLKFMQKVIMPLFQKPFDRYILLIEPILLEFTVLKKFNIDLIQKYKRKKKFSNTLLDIHETHAMLLKNLSSDFSKNIIEFKPKWLTQSISAPKGWKSCRTCALRRFRGNMTKNDIRYCPLDLASGNQVRIQKSLRAILMENQIHNKLNLSLYFQQSPLINHLKYLQRNSPKALGMTFRDCTIHITFFHDNFFEVKMLDLDYKPHTKIKYWDTIEQQLINGGWYLGRGMTNDEEPCRI
ncbi:hypothetical protein PCANB_002382 [Pneumocystis canis]|nr:hypothetical protein PCANB_002382 [Pneumocystis canis]